MDSKTTATTDMRSQLVDTILKAYLEGFNNPGPDGAGFVARRTPDCLHYVHPASAGLASSFTNETYIAFITRVASLVHNLHINLLNGFSPIVDEKERRVMLHLTGGGELPIGPYTNSYIFYFQLTDDGTQIKRIDEFLDVESSQKLVMAVGAGVVQGVIPVAPPSKTPGQPGEGSK